MPITSVEKNVVLPRWLWKYAIKNKEIFYKLKNAARMLGSIPKIFFAFSFVCLTVSAPVLQLPGLLSASVLAMDHFFDLSIYSHILFISPYAGQD